MKLLESFFDAIVRLEGDSLVMHVGEKPYVVTTSAMGEFRGPLAWGQVELSSKPLSLPFLEELLTQVLLPEQRTALLEVGAAEREVTPESQPGERFIIIAARGGDDLWVEVRRKPKEVPRPIAQTPSPAPEASPPVVHPPVAETVAPPVVPELPAETSIPSAETAVAADVAPDAEPDVEPEAEPAVQHVEEPEPVGAVQEPEPDVGHEMAPDVADTSSDDEGESPILEIYQYDHAAVESSRAVDTGAVEWDHAEPSEVYELTAEDVHEIAFHAPATDPPAEPVVDDGEVAVEEAPAVEEPTLLSPEAYVTPDSELEVSPEIAATIDETAGAGAEQEPEPEQIVSAAEDEPPALVPEVLAETEPEREEIVSSVPASEESVAPPAAAAVERPVIVRIPRPTSELKAPPEVVASREPMPIDQLIRAAMDAGGSVLYVVADSRPMVRAAGQMRVLKGQPVITAESIDQFILESGPVREPGTPSVSEATEWEFALTGAGRVRCVAFHDRSGPGLILHVIASEATTLEQLGVPPAVFEFSDEADGLVIVAGPRSSGKSTLLHALIDRMNRTRSDHVITIESRIGFVHDTRSSLVSQREVSGDGEAIGAAARAALREGPDILVIDDLRSPDAIAVAIDAARAGRLILGSIAAPSSTAAVERLIDVFAPSRRPQVRALLAGILRGVVTQALVRDKSGARIAARELLLSSPAVRQLIADGEFERLDTAIEAGRAHGMMRLSAVLLALVRDGHVDAAEARRHAPDREAFTALLRRAGLDVSSGERLA